MRVAFWNTHNNPGINLIITKMIVEKNIDLVILAEYASNLNQLIDYVNCQGRRYRAYFTGGCQRIRMLGSVENVDPGPMQDYYALQIIDKNVLLCALHLNSNIYGGTADKRQHVINDIKQEINQIHNKGIYKTIIVGDFNENPYEKNIMGINGFNGVPIFEKAIKGYRVDSGIREELYYNPMWNFFGDFLYPMGTCYYGSNEPFWHIYDQVLISSSLLNCFCKEELEIVTKIGDVDLKNKNGVPNTECFSDHFPIIFEIKGE